MADRLLTVYSRAQCHLCGEMIEALRSWQGLTRFEVEIVDVDSDPALVRRYGDKVPVLAHGARELCHYRLDLDALAEYLAKVS
jgi:hypothetical protein